MVGGLYGLFGLGLALAFGIMRVVNVAHGEFIVLAAYLGVTLLTLTPLPLPASLSAWRSRPLRSAGCCRRRCSTGCSGPIQFPE